MGTGLETDVPRVARECWTIDSRYIVQAVAGAGSPFFSRDAMRFFGSRVAGSGWQVKNTDGWNHTYVLVTSERDTYTGGPRLYTVRIFAFDDYARRVTVEQDSAGFQGYATGAAARRAAERVARAIAAGGAS